jgi:catechol 2,3-dioxygenase-like lactoylglutathione lyase family enzyme
MNNIQVEQKSYEMPPREGFTVTHFITVADIDRSAEFYERVFGGRILSRGDTKGASGHIQIANTWLIVNVGGGPTPDKLKRAMTYGKVEEPSSSRNRLTSTARFAATSAILTVTLSKSGKANRNSSRRRQAAPAVDLAARDERWIRHVADGERPAAGERSSDALVPRYRRSHESLCRCARSEPHFCAVVGLGRHARASSVREPQTAPHDDARHDDARSQKPCHARAGEAHHTQGRDDGGSRSPFDLDAASEATLKPRAKQSFERRVAHVADGERPAAGE